MFDVNPHLDTEHNDRSSDIRSNSDILHSNENFDFNAQRQNKGTGSAGQAIILANPTILSGGFKIGKRE